MKKIFVINGHDMATSSWFDNLAWFFLGAIMTILFGYAFFEIFSEEGNIIPPIIFAGLMTVGGLFIFFGSLFEMLKKFLHERPDKLLLKFFGERFLCF